MASILWKRTKCDANVNANAKIPLDIALKTKGSPLFYNNSVSMPRFQGEPLLVTDLHSTQNLLKALNSKTELFYCLGKVRQATFTSTALADVRRDFTLWPYLPDRSRIAASVPLPPGAKVANHIHPDLTLDHQTSLSGPAHAGPGFVGGAHVHPRVLHADVRDHQVSGAEHLDSLHADGAAICTGKIKRKSGFEADEGKIASM